MSRRTRLWVALTAIFTAVGLLNFGHFYLDDLARQHPGSLTPRLIEEMTGAYAALALMPLILWVGARLCWTKADWLRSAALLVTGAVVYSFMHTTLMALSRAIVFPLAGLGPYDYGIMILRYPMEYANDEVSFSILVGFVYLFHRLSEAKRAEVETAHLQQKLAEAKLENLHLQLQPHFLFNTLNAISSVMYEDVGKADQMLARLSDFLRTVLASSDVHEVSLTEELRIEQMYVDIMKARLERRLQLHVAVDAAAAHAKVPFMLLQPLLENSIRHGRANESDALAIEVDVRRDGAQTVVTVADDGVGYAQPATGHGGHGLSNVASRLAYLYDGSSSFDIERSTDGGTVATMRFPFSEVAG